MPTKNSERIEKYRVKGSDAGPTEGRHARRRGEDWIWTHAGLHLGLQIAWHRRVAMDFSIFEGSNQAGHAGDEDCAQQPSRDDLKPEIITQDRATNV